MKRISTHKNGNALVEIFEDGTREISWEGELDLTSPLNVDIRVSTECSFGWDDERNVPGVCFFCHESAKKVGHEADYTELFDKLNELPSGTELAIGCNAMTDDLFLFIVRAAQHGLIVNLTVNLGHWLRDKHKILSLIADKYVHGLGISYRSDFKSVLRKTDELFSLDNVVLHVISGLDDFDEIASLSSSFKKLLVLGEKDFGFNEGKVDLTSASHRKWFAHLHELFKTFEVVSFDNLAVEQLHVRRFFNDNNWNTFYQGEHSFYINGVNQTFSRSSRSKETASWKDTTLLGYWNRIKQNG